MDKALKHIAFIPDGNRRWAKQAGMPKIEGHRKGYERFKDVAQWCLDRGIRDISFWAFSTENWKRTEEEVGYLMDLMLRVLTTDLEEFAQQGFRLHVIGRRSHLSERLQEAIERAEVSTKDNTGGNLYLCFNYGGRPEIVEAVRTCLREGLDPEVLTEEAVSQRLWSAVMPDIDLIVRTSGEQRLSGFQPWKGNYAELYFVDHHWPAFNEVDLDEAITFYEGRERRFGGDSSLSRS